MIRLILLATWLGFGVNAYTQNCPTIKGKVVDAETREPLPGANIRSVHNPTLGISSGVDGNFTLVGKADSIKISFIGYQEEVIAVTIECYVIIFLKPLSAEMNEVEIRAPKLIAEEFTFKSIRKLEIYTNPSAKADPLLAVNSLPAATTLDESANISLRGGSPDETGVILNGVPINDAVRYSRLNGIGTFSVFNTAMINKVQVYPGNPPLEFGNVISGLIALQTDEQLPSKPTTLISLSLANTGIYSSFKTSKKSSLIAFSNQQNSTLLRELNYNALELIKKFNSVDLGLHHFSQLTNSISLKIFNYTVKESFTFLYTQPTFEGDLLQNKLRNFTILNAIIKKRYSELSVNGGASFSKANFAYSITNIDLKLTDYFTSVNYHYFKRAFEIKSGFSIDSRTSDFKGSFPLYDYAVGDKYPINQSEVVNKSEAPEFYSCGKYFLTSKWIVGIGARKNIPTRNQQKYTSWQACINYRPTSTWSFNLSSGDYHKYQLPQGETSEAFLIQSRQYSFDAEYTNDKLTGTFSAFYKETNRLTTQAITKGTEIFVRYRISPSLRSQISVTSLDAQQEKLNTKSPSPYNIHYFVRGNLEYKLGTWTLTTVFMLRQGSYYNPLVETVYDNNLDVYRPVWGDAMRLPDYRIIDFSLSKIYLIKKKFSSVAFCGLTNAFNFKNVERYSYDFDYSTRTAQLFSQRIIYFGTVITL